MTGGVNASPIEDYLDELLRRCQADPRTARRLLDEAADHLHAASADLEAAGMSRLDAEHEAVRRIGPVAQLVRGTWRRSFTALVFETLRAAIMLGGVGLVAVGISGAVAAVMNAVFGPSFVGGTTVLGVGGGSVLETADDAVVLRAFAGGLGLILLGAHRVLDRHANPTFVLPAGLIDALGAAAFSAATVVLAGACVMQAVTGEHANGVGFFLSGAVVSLLCAVIFCTRATRALLLRFR